MPEPTAPDRGKDRAHLISIRGAAEHNLKNIDLEIPRNCLTVVTGLSGSGKSSLAYDIIYREGQRRFVESLSAYARQYLGRLDKPKVEHIEGLSPTISIDQKTISRNPRSTVGTITEVLDHLRLLMARLGQPYCPKCGDPITSRTVDQIVDAAYLEWPDEDVIVAAPIVMDRKGEYRKELADLKSQGFVRVIRTLGERVVSMRPVNGFAAESAAASVIELATRTGTPVSTTHVITSSIIGMGSTRRLSAVRWGVAKSIVYAWILTFPACALLGAALFHLINLVTN